MCCTCAGCVAAAANLKRRQINVTRKALVAYILYVCSAHNIHNVSSLIIHPFFVTLCGRSSSFPTQYRFIYAVTANARRRVAPAHARARTFSFGWIAIIDELILSAISLHARYKAHNATTRARARETEVNKDRIIRFWFYISASVRNCVIAATLLIVVVHFLLCHLLYPNLSSPNRCVILSNNTVKWGIEGPRLSSAFTLWVLVVLVDSTTRNLLSYNLLDYEKPRTAPGMLDPFEFYEIIFLAKSHRVSPGEYTLDLHVEIFVCCKIVFRNEFWSFFPKFTVDE